MASGLIIGNNDVSYVFDGNSKYSNTAIQNFAYSTINRLWIYATQRVGGNTKNIVLMKVQKKQT